MVEWETVTMFVQRDKRTGAILRMQEEPPTECIAEELQRIREARKAVRMRIAKREMGD